MSTGNDRIKAYEESRKMLSRVVSEHHPRPRMGKTAKDKAKGHKPYQPNRRVWTGSGPQDPKGAWEKA